MVAHNAGSVHPRLNNPYALKLTKQLVSGMGDDDYPLSDNNQYELAFGKHSALEPSDL